MPNVIIYSQTVCPYCTSAKNLFKSLSVPFEEVNLDDKAPEFREKLSRENNGWRTVPMIFINNKFIGGFDDANKLHKNGELIKLIGV